MRVRREQPAPGVLTAWRSKCKCASAASALHVARWPTTVAWPGCLANPPEAGLAAQEPGHAEAAPMVIHAGHPIIRGKRLEDAGDGQATRLRHAACRSRERIECCMPPGGRPGPACWLAVPRHHTQQPMDDHRNMRAYLLQAGCPRQTPGALFPIVAVPATRLALKSTRALTAVWLQSRSHVELSQIASCWLPGRCRDSVLWRPLLSLASHTID